MDVKGLLQEFEHVALRGEYQVYDMNKGEVKWVPIPGSTKLINEQGVREIIGRLMGFVNKATKLSWYEDEEIYKNMYYFDMGITEMIAKRSGEWELDIEAAKGIKDAAIELVMSIMFSAREGFTAINLRSQYSKQDISRSDAVGGKQKTFFGIPLGKG